MKSLRVYVSFALALITLTMTGPAAAFEPAEDKLFIDWSELATNPAPGRETQVYAIVSEGGEAIYVIVSNAQGRLQPMGAFACSDRFDVLSSSSNGFRDIACVNQGSKAILRADAYGEYRYAN
ncbi:MAG TPA: hypothetical protein ENK83_06305 [Aliiroseovarius sp.]|nr:hypothetical protein [Aliiroseovarius sp.]